MRLGQELSDWVHLKGSIPQGTWFGPLLFVILINDLCPPCATHKYMDDTTLTVRVGKGSVSSMQSIMDFTTSWSSANNMVPNIRKTKDMVICFHKQPTAIPPVTIQGMEIERVSSTKLLGVVINDKLTWADNTNYIYSKASKRLYHLRQLESIQRRSMKIIEPNLTYELACAKHSLIKTSARREKLAKKFSSAICLKSSRLHYLLPQPINTRYSLRNRRKLPLPKVKTNRFKHSLIPHGLFNYQ